MKKRASACRDRCAALAGKRIVGTCAAALIARTVASTFSWVTPVEPPAAAEVVAHLRRLWGFAVQLETDEGDGRIGTVIQAAA